jgi:hypothetical protein
MMRKVLIEIAKLCKTFPLVPITIVSLLCLLEVYRTHGIISWPGDAPTYQYAATLLQQGEFDIFRTPSYPLIILLCRWLSFSESNVLLIVVQILLFYVSVYSLYFTMLRLKISKNVAAIISGVFALNPFSIFACLIPITESLATSLSIFLIHFFVKWLQDKRWRSFTYMSMCGLFLIFMRPSFLYIVVAFAIVAAIMSIKRAYKESIQLFALVAIYCGLVFGYCKNIEAKSGVFTLSTVSLYNDYHNFANIGKWKSDYRVINQCILFNGDEDPPAKANRVTNFQAKQLYDKLQETKEKDRLYLLKFFVVNLRLSMYYNYDGYCDLTFDFCLIYALLMFIGMFLVYLARHRRIAVIAIFLWLMCVGNIMVDLLGSTAEWSRLFLPSLPLLLLLIAQGCNMFKIKFRPVPLV